MENLGQGSAEIARGWRSGGSCSLPSTGLVPGTLRIPSHCPSNACTSVLPSRLLDEETAVQRACVPYPRSHR